MNHTISRLGIPARVKSRGGWYYSEDILGWIKEAPDLTLQELSQRLRDLLDVGAPRDPRAQDRLDINTVGFDPPCTAINRMRPVAPPYRATKAAVTLRPQRNARARVRRCG